MTDVFVELAPTGRGADTEDALRSLLRWLHEDETLDGAVRGRLADRAAPVPGHMGAGGFDILQLALGSGLSTAALVVSVLQWQLARHRAPALVLSRGELQVQVTPEGARDAETLRRVVELLDQQPAGVAGDGESDGGAA
ncbi:effector-associated constant component EACC1 [Actinomycetota bacterium Odt1-20B]